MAAPHPNALPPPRDPSRPYRVCLVCLGNICRSPMAEVVLREHLRAVNLAEKVLVDSAGTEDWHVGRPMNSRARGALARRGYPGEGHRARQVSADRLAASDLVLAMDAGNFETLKNFYAMVPADRPRLRLFGDLAGMQGADVPDPYRGNPADFARVLDMLERGMPVLVAALAELVEDPAVG